MDLLKIQEFFAHGGRTKPLVPIKERSLDIFGDEKRLDQLYRNSALFGEGRLTLKNLGCFVVSEPLPWTPGPATEGPLLVIENAAAWHTFCRWNTECKIFSAIIYGCGNRFMDGTDSLREILRTLGGPRRVFYFGDLDPQGLHIPQEASFRAQSDALIYLLSSHIYGAIANCSPSARPIRSLQTASRRQLLSQIGSANSPNPRDNFLPQGTASPKSGSGGNSFKAKTLCLINCQPSAKPPGARRDPSTAMNSRAALDRSTAKYAEAD